MSIKYKGKTVAGGAGKDATINGQNAVEIVAGDGVEIEQQDGTLTISAAGGTGGGVPSGCILIWSGASNAVPDGWALCDGENGTPDLRGRFILGASENHSLGETGGSEEVTLTEAQMPIHGHSFNIDATVGVHEKSRRAAIMGSGATTYITLPTGNLTNPVEAAGSSDPHSNMPPYYVLCYIMKL